MAEMTRRRYLFVKIGAILLVVGTALVWIAALTEAFHPGVGFGIEVVGLLFCLAIYLPERN